MVHYLKEVLWSNKRAHCTSLWNWGVMGNHNRLQKSNKCYILVHNLRNPDHQQKYVIAQKTELFSSVLVLNLLHPDSGYNCLSIHVLKET